MVVGLFSKIYMAQATCESWLSVLGKPLVLGKSLQDKEQLVLSVSPHLWRAPGRASSSPSEAFAESTWQGNTASRGEKDELGSLRRQEVLTATNEQALSALEFSVIPEL